MLSPVKERILIIEDDAAFMNQAGEWLQNVGYKLITAENGTSGIRRLYTGQPDLVLLDLSLPEMDGWEVCKRIREMSDIPIIMLNSGWPKSDILKGFSLGADDFVTKPPDYPELIARVGGCLTPVNLNKTGR